MSYTPNIVGNPASRQTVNSKKSRHIFSALSIELMKCYLSNFHMGLKPITSPLTLEKYYLLCVSLKLSRWGRCFGSHAIPSILGYVARLFSMVSYAWVVLHASSFKRNRSCMLSLSTSLQWSVEHLTDKILQKVTRPMSLWESNPLVSVYQTNSLP